MSEEIAEAAAEQQEAPERDQVGIDDPRKRLLGKAQVFTNRRQRHADDRHVENDHQIAEAENEER